MERKRLRQDSARQQDMELAAQDMPCSKAVGPAEPVQLSSAKEQPRRQVATPMSSTYPCEACPGIEVRPSQITDQSIQNLDRLQGVGPLEGTVQSRCDHRSGGGFHVRIGDATGNIDIKFWRLSADAFRHHQGLQKGTVIRIQGFKIHRLTQKQLEFAPAGRSIELVYDGQPGISIEVLSPSTLARTMLEVGPQEALLNPPGTCVNVIAWVADVSDVEIKRIRAGQDMPFRVVWLASDLDESVRVRWVLWNDTAQAYGTKQLLRQRVRLRGVGVKQTPMGGKELTGCWREGGIEVMPR